MQGANNNTFGEYLNASLPNIIGIVNAGCGVPAPAVSGAFSNIGTAGNGYANAQYQNMRVDFDASRCSSIYSNETTTVQPNSLCINFCIKY